MRRALRITAIVLGVAMLAPIAIVGLVLIAASTRYGDRLIEQAIFRLTHGEIVVQGLSVELPGGFRLVRLELRDPRGTWLSADDGRVEWSLSRLLSGDPTVDWLSADGVHFDRIPIPTGPPKPPPSLPIPVRFQVVDISRFDIGPDLIGTAAAFRASGSGRLHTLDDSSVDAKAERLDSPGRYAVVAAIGRAGITIRAEADEPAGGLLAVAGKLPDIGAITARATLEGPRADAALTADVAAGELRAGAHGRINLDSQSADLTLAARAPAMTPRPDFSWQSVAVDAHVSGSATAPEASGTIRIDGLVAAGASATSVNADVAGDKGRIDARPPRSPICACPALNPTCWPPHP